MTRPIGALIIRNLLRFLRDRMRLAFHMMMAVLIIFLFSFITIPDKMGIVNPINYLIAGVTIMLVFNVSLVNSSHLMEDIASGFMKEILVAPIARWQIALGHIFSTMIIATIEGLLVIGIGFFTGLRIDTPHMVLTIGVMVLVSFTFSSFGLFLATLTKDSTNFQILVNLISGSWIFLSGAYIPITMLPRILAPIVYSNPLTYTTSAFRFVTLQMEHQPVDELIKAGIALKIGTITIMPVTSILLMAAGGVFFLILCVNRFTTADFSRVRIFKRR